MRKILCNLFGYIVLLILSPVLIYGYCVVSYYYCFAKRPNKMFGTHD